MAETKNTEVKVGLLKDFNDEYFMPRTIASQVFTSDGETLEKCCSDVKNELANKANKIELPDMRLYLPKVATGTKISTNSDLNTINFLKVDDYYCESNSDAATLTNCPATVAFMMNVYSPISSNVDNEETGTWVYRIRKILTYSGEEYTQQVYSNATKGNFIYGEWSKTFKMSASDNSSSLNVIPVQRGGTGKTNLTLNSVLVGNGNNSIQNISSKDGAFYSTNSGVTPQFGTLPIAQGGTGATTATDALTNLGAMSAVDPVGTGSFSLNRSQGSVIGSNSVAMGHGSEASGRNSIAIGYNVLAEGTRSVAIGHNSFAYGNSSTSICGSADGKESFAAYADAVGDYSIALANGTANGKYSVAIGLSSQTTEENAIAIGQAALATGLNSIAIGTDVNATGQYSFAEGVGTESNGYASHAEGVYAIAASNGQHAQGRYNVEDLENKYAHIVGNGTSASSRSNAHTLDWEGNAWFAGDISIGGNGQDDTNSKKLITEDQINIKMDKDNPTGTGSFSLNRLANSTIGTNSIALGENTTASGLRSFATGQETIASGQNAHAEGTYSSSTIILSGSANSRTYTRRKRVNANSQRVQGYVDSNTNQWVSNSSIFTLRVQLIAGQQYNVIFNGNLQNSNFAIYYYTSMPNTSGSAAGFISKEIIASNSLLITPPSNCQYALIPQATAIFYHTNETDGESLLGRYLMIDNEKITISSSTATQITFSKTLSNTNIEDQSYTLHYATTASGTSSHAEGSGTTASDTSSHAEGSGTTASGSYSHAEGLRSVASGMASHAEGQDAKASGSSSHAEGSGTTASGSYSHAEGLNTIAAKTGQHVQGKYNLEDTHSSQNNQYAHIVGNGTSNANRSNAHTLDWKGNAWFQGDVYVGGTGQEDSQAIKLLSQSDIEDYATKEYVSQAILDASLGGDGNDDYDHSIFALKSDLNTLATKTELNSYATKTELNSYVVKDDLNDFAITDNFIIPIENGGTGSSTRMEAYNNLRYQLTVPLNHASTSGWYNIGRVNAIHTTSSTSAFRIVLGSQYNHFNNVAHIFEAAVSHDSTNIIQIFSSKDTSNTPYTKIRLRKSTDVQNSTDVYVDVYYNLTSVNNLYATIIHYMGNFIPNDVLTLTNDNTNILQEFNIDGNSGLFTSGILGLTHGGTGATTKEEARNNLSAAKGSEITGSISGSPGWYRIAVSDKNIEHCNGIFQIKGRSPNRHTVATLIAGTLYGRPDSTKIGILYCSHYTNAAFTKARIVYSSSYENNYAYLDLYVPENVTITTVIDVTGGLGWNLISPQLIANIPNGYSKEEKDLDHATLKYEKFAGNGSGLTSLNASNITSGTLSNDRLDIIPLAKGGTGATTADGALSNLGLTATVKELNYTDGVTSNIQTQLNNKLSKNSDTAKALTIDGLFLLNDSWTMYGSSAPTSSFTAKVGRVYFQTID